MAAILVVDDEIDGTEALARMLRGAGHEVAIAPDGHEAVHRVTEAKPDLILLDLMMPRMDGLAFLGVLRSYLGWQHVPVLLHTAYPESPKVREAVRLSACEVLAKGQLSLADVRERIEAALRGANGPAWYPASGRPVAGG